MKLTRNGHLQLGKRDLLSEVDEPTGNPQKAISIDLFKSDAQVAIFYARQVKASVRYRSIHGIFKVVGEGIWGYPDNVVYTWQNLKKKRKRKSSRLKNSAKEKSS